jgi:hypothetical protein
MASTVTNALAPAYQAPSYQDSLQNLKLRIPQDYQAGSLQKAQETAQAPGGIDNSLLMSGPDADFYKALQAFKEHFGGAR